MNIKRNIIFALEGRKKNGVPIIKSVMKEYGETTECHKAVGEWLCGYAEHRQPFDQIKHRHTLKEVDDVAMGLYDGKINKRQNKGFKI